MSATGNCRRRLQRAHLQGHLRPPAIKGKWRTSRLFVIEITELPCRVHGSNCRGRKSPIGPDEGERQQKLREMERETGIEPVTSSLGSWRSTAELLPLDSLNLTQHSASRFDGKAALKFVCSVVFKMIGGFTLLHPPKEHGAGPRILHHIIRHCVYQPPHALRNRLRVLIKGSGDVAVAQVGLYVLRASEHLGICRKGSAEHLKINRA